MRIAADGSWLPRSNFCKRSPNPRLIFYPEHFQAAWGVPQNPTPPETERSRGHLYWGCSQERRKPAATVLHDLFRKQHEHDDWWPACEELGRSLRFREGMARITYRRLESGDAGRAPTLEVRFLANWTRVKAGSW